VRRLTDTLVEIEGENMRPVTWRCPRVKSGGLGHLRKPLSTAGRQGPWAVGPARRLAQSPRHGQRSGVRRRLVEPGAPGRRWQCCWPGPGTGRPRRRASFPSDTMSTHFPLARGQHGCRPEGFVRQGCAPAACAPIARSHLTPAR